jgi:hypothetical protein
MYGNYRLSKASTFYFIFFKNIPKEDERHIIVLDRTDSGWEWTFGKNQTKVVHGGWDEIVQQFPVLAKYKDNFVNKPLTDEEKEYQRKLGEFARNPTKDNFDKFTYQHKSDALKFGMDLPIDLFQSLDKYLRNEWISVGPKIKEEIFKLLTDSEKSRLFKVKEQQLLQREPQDTYDVEICKNNEELYEKYLKQDEMQSISYDWKIIEISVGIFKVGEIPTKYFLPPKLNEIKEIDGVLYLPNFIGELNLPQLKRINGSIDASKANSVNSPKLEYVNGSIDASKANSVNLPKLEYVNGQTGSINCDASNNIDFPQLKRVNGMIFATKANIVNLPKLESTNGNSIYISMQTKKITIQSYLVGNIRINYKNFYRDLVNIDTGELINKKIQIIEPTETQENLNDSVIYNLVKSFLLKS